MSKKDFNVRIAKQDGEKWHGFTLRRGHLFLVVQNCDGTKDLIVTALEPGKNNTIKIYAASYAFEKCRPYFIPAGDELIQRFKDAAPILREKTGIDSVEHTTVQDEIRNKSIARLMLSNGKANLSGGRVFC